MTATYEEWCRQRGCERKRNYPSEAVARNAATLLAWIGSPGNGPYRCEWCAEWHVGHSAQGTP